MTMQRKTLSAKFDAAGPGFTATITTDTLDRDGEVVIPGGMNSADYESNPILFWNHDFGMPVGKCVSLKRQPNSIVGDFVFAQRPDGFVGDFFPEFVSALVGQGIIRGVSIGYAPEQGGTRRATVDDRKRFGDAVHTVYNKWKLLEVSIAPLQANPDALISAVRKGAVSRADAERWLGYAEPKRVQIVVPCPAVGAFDRRAKRAAPIDTNAIVAREIARARGSLR